MRRGRGWPPVTSQGCQGWSQGFDTTLSGYMTDFDFKKNIKKLTTKRRDMVRDKGGRWIARVHVWQKSGAVWRPSQV